MFDTEEVVKNLEKFGIQASLAGAGLAKISSKKMTQKNKIKQSSKTTDMALTISTASLQTYIKGKLVDSMKEAYQKETEQISQL